MPTWNGVTFRILAENQDNTIKRAVIAPEDFGVVRTKIPYANLEHVQFTGRGNPRLVLHCEIYSDTDFATLLASAATGLYGTLGNPYGNGVNYSSLLLMEVKNIWRVSFEEEIHFDLVFDQQVIV